MKTKPRTRVPKDITASSLRRIKRGGGAKRLPRLCRRVQRPTTRAHGRSQPFMSATAANPDGRKADQRVRSSRSRAATMSASSAPEKTRRNWRACIVLRTREPSEIGAICLRNATWLCVIGGILWITSSIYAAQAALPPLTAFSLRGSTRPDCRCQPSAECSSPRAYRTAQTRAAQTCAPT